MAEPIQENNTLNKKKLKIEQLRRFCDPNSLGFTTTDELPDLQTVIGQPRALKAFELGSDVQGKGYNIFVLGLPDSGRTTLSREYLERKARDEKTPDDWCYVNNFDNPQCPKALRLPAGKGIELRKDVNEFIEYCKREIPQAFNSEEYFRERDRLLEKLKTNQEQEFIELQKHVENYNFMVGRTASGIVLLPAKDGKPLKKEEVESLSEDQKSKLEELSNKLNSVVEKTKQKLRILAEETFIKINDLNHNTTEFVVEPAVKRIRKKYKNIEPAASFIDEIHGNISENPVNFLPIRTEDQLPAFTEPGIFKQYQINLLVDNSTLEGTPVIVESHPSYPNLIGRIEHEMVMGASRTDFTMIREGALHRANGGYLIIPARDLLINPYAWEGLKRVLRDGNLRVTNVSSQVGLTSTASLDPEPIPTNIKVIMVGTPMLYYLLQSYDEDFAKLFKVRAEFATRMGRTSQNESEYGLFIKSVVAENDLLSFDNTAVAEIIDFSSRLASDRDKLSTRFGKISDVVRESSYWAGKDGSEIVSQKDVIRAIDEKDFRNNLLDMRLQEMLEEDTLMIDLTGNKTGQINALSVLSLGDYQFGKPTRITSSVYPGQKGIIDIERQAKLGGPIHTKGVLIISGYLGNKYGQIHPLSISANLTFEQSYEGVEGDSASAAELICLLSEISKIPIRQDLAITGSVNQHGQIQAVGGVNEKIEGFFNICKAKGLTGVQGVIIPESNVRNLMLIKEVISSVEDGKFHLYSIQTIDEGIELLTGVSPGERADDLSYPEGSFNYSVMERLEQFYKIGKEEPEEE